MASNIMFKDFDAWDWNLVHFITIMTRDIITA